MHLPIITPPEWGARPPKTEATLCPKAKRIIIHHTAGHHPEISRSGYESHDEAKAYARAIQNYHMDTQGWNDSGHNFLVCRSGDILVGRWVTVTAIQHKLMVVSAHCPGQNDQIGIEHEHVSGEEMTKPQIDASARLIAWISVRYGRRWALPLFPHHQFYATDCPDNVEAVMPELKRRANELLTAGAID